MKQKNGHTVENYPNGYDRTKVDNLGNYLNKEEDSFTFGGNNYIEVHRENGFDLTNGLTFVFYGTIVNGLASNYFMANGPVGFLDLWDGNYSSYTRNRILTRYGTTEGDFSFLWVRLIPMWKVGLILTGDNIYQALEVPCMKDKIEVLVLSIRPKNDHTFEEILKIYDENTLMYNAQATISSNWYHRCLETCANYKYLEFGRARHWSNTSIAAER